jgi:hypothetical protein
MNIVIKCLVTLGVILALTVIIRRIVFIKLLPSLILASATVFILYPQITTDGYEIDPVFTSVVAILAISVLAYLLTCMFRDSRFSN